MAARPLLLASILLFAVTGMPAARAHAFLDHAAPRVGSTLRAPPHEIRLWFTEPIEPAFSSIEVTDAAGRRVDRGKAEIDPRDPTVLRLALPPLPPGRYTVAWRVISVDTHPTEGGFAFTIGGG